MVSSGCMRASTPESPAHDDAGLPAVATGFLPVVINCRQRLAAQMRLAASARGVQQETRRRTCSDTRPARPAPSNGPPDGRASTRERTVRPDGASAPSRRRSAVVGQPPHSGSGPVVAIQPFRRGSASQDGPTPPDSFGGRTANRLRPLSPSGPHAVSADGTGPRRSRGRTHRGRSPAGAQARGGDGPRQDAVGGSALVAGPPIFLCRRPAPPARAPRRRCARFVGSRLQPPPPTCLPEKGPR